MALSPNILPGDVDALSPVDEYLMGAIRENLSSIDSSITNGAFNPVIQFKLNGPLSMLPGGKAKRVDSVLITSQQTINSVAMYLDTPGTSGTLEIDLRKVTTPKISILNVVAQYTAATQSISRAGSALSTQSITRTTPQISTQAVSQWKPSLAVESIIGLGNNLWQYNLSGSNPGPDDDWKVGDTVTFSGCQNPSNNGSFTIVRVNDYNSRSVVITNASGAQQSSIAGSCVLRAYSYVFTNPVSSQFVAGEQALFASHTDANNNGTRTIYAVNVGGNNIIVKNPNGATQASAAGVVDVLRFSYNLSTSASAADYVVGDTLNASSHSSAGNNGNFTITALNNGGTNIQVYNPSGTTQGGVAGSVNSNQWVYALLIDPVSNVSVGDSIEFSSHSNTANNGIFKVRQVNRAATTNITIHNSAGVAQAGVAGAVTHTRAVVSIGQDVSESGTIVVGSWVEIEGTPYSTLNSISYSNLGLPVVEINRGGGANYNLVLQLSTGSPNQVARAGWVAVESRSIFSATPKLVITPNAARTLGQTATLSGSGDSVISDPQLQESTKLALYVLSVPTGADSLGVQIR